MATSDSKNIEFDQLGISETLKRYELVVPRYQRDYSWGKEYVETYLQDISFAIGDDEPTYFLGSLVVIDKGANVREVVDGQQRLATTSLLLASIKHLSKENSDISRALDTFLVSLDLGSIGQTKMSLNNSDVSVFSSLILEGLPGIGYVENRPSHKRLIDSYELCKAHMIKVAELVTETKKTEVFERWVKYLQFNTQVILISVSSELNAFRMFETLNDRGLKVSQADLIKNYLFSKSGSKISVAQESWTSTKGTLESIDDDEIMVNFIRHVLMATNKFVQRKNIYKDIQESAKGENTSIDMLNKLEALASNYIAIHNPESPIWRGYPFVIKEHIRVILIFDIQPLKPLLLAASKKLVKKECEKLFRYAISMSVRLTLASASRPTSMAVEKPISEAAIQIWDDKFTKASQVIENLSSVIPNDPVFESEFNSATVSKPHLARYYLRAIERAFKNEPNPSHIPNEDPSSVTLEHVLPYHPQGNWPEFNTEEQQAYKNRIGNLALLKSQDNTDLASGGFSEKSRIYKESAFGTTEMIHKYSNWNVESIQSRQEKLCKWALLAWPMS